MEELKHCKSFSEAARLLGYSYYNGSVKNKIITKCKELGVDIESVITNYKSRKVYCKNCGCEILGKHRLENTFCSSSCAASFNNKKRGAKSRLEKKTIRTSLCRTRLLRGFKTIEDCIKDGLLLNPYNIDIKDRLISQEKCQERNCVVCGRLFKPYITKKGLISQTHTCSNECKKIELGKAGKLGYASQVNNGTFKGWQSRNILSFPERFWINVLTNNSIRYSANKPFKGYFLDFYIEVDGRKIDLEIDGGQHKLPDRVISDSIRDKIITSSGIEVYRVEWNEVTSQKGKELMKEKIEDFLKFLKCAN